MNKLPEPDLPKDIYWPRLQHGVQEMKDENTKNYWKWFVVVGGLASFRYLREVTFYKKNFAQTAVMVPLLLLSSHFIAETKFDKYVLAAEENNKREQEYITKYKSLYKKAKANNIALPDNLIY